MLENKGGCLVKKRNVEQLVSSIKKLESPKKEKYFQNGILLRLEVNIKKTSL